MKKRLTAGAGALFVLALAASLSPAAAQIKIGALYPFSDALAPLGDESFRGVELAVEERNAAGGLKGKKIEIVKGDAVDPSQAVGEEARSARTAPASRPCCARSTA